MKFSKPYKVPYHTSQGFSLNFNPYYQNGGLLGHTGIDMVAPHLTPIFAVVDSYCYSYINKANKDLMRYRAVYTLVEDAGVWYEISYGHLIDFLVEPKTHLKTGDPIGTQGNTGNVFVGGKPPTAEAKKNGAGSHLHFQLRVVKPVDQRETKKTYLRDANGFLKYQNKYWEVLNYKNGFNGCIDPAPFFKTLTAVLRYGDKGEQVKILQKILNIPSDGIFGLGTEKAVKAFQTKHKLKADGVVGQLTIKALNEI